MAINDKGTSKKPIPLTLRLTREQHEKLRGKALELGVSLNSLITMLAELGLGVLDGAIIVRNQ